MKCVARRWPSDGQRELSTSGLSFVADNKILQDSRAGGPWVGGAFCPKRRSRFVEEEKMLSAQLTPVNLSAVIQSSHYSLFLPSSDEKTWHSQTATSIWLQTQCGHVFLCCISMKIKKKKGVWVYSLNNHLFYIWAGDGSGSLLWNW